MQWTEKCLTNQNVLYFIFFKGATSDFDDSFAHIGILSISLQTLKDVAHPTSFSTVVLVGCYSYS